MMRKFIVLLMCCGFAVAGCGIKGDPLPVAQVG